MTTEELRGYVPGAVLVVQRLAGNRPDVTVVRTPAPEAQATTTRPGTPRPGRGGRTLVRVVNLAIVAIVAALVLLPAWGSRAVTTSGAPTSTPTT